MQIGLTRLLPLPIGDIVAENYDAWCIILELKDIVEPSQVKSLCYLDVKINEHLFCNCNC